MAGLLLIRDHYNDKQFTISLFNWKKLLECHISQGFVSLPLQDNTSNTRVTFSNETGTLVTLPFGL